MAICEVCGKNTAERTISQIPMCASCFKDLQMIRNSDQDKCKEYEHKKYLSERAQNYFMDLIDEKLGSQERLIALQNAKKLEIERENQKQIYAKSFREYYEYDVVTVINQDHGTIDRNKMVSLLNEKAQQGWKLHTVYSNELGKNALRILGFGVNSTACEDVLIFERRIEHL